MTKTNLEIEEEKYWIVEKPNDTRKVKRLYVQYETDTEYTTDVGYTENPQELKDFIETKLQQRMDEIVNVIKNSRTVDEQYGIGLKEEQTRNQVLVDVLSLSIIKSVDKNK